MKKKSILLFLSGLFALVVVGVFAVENNTGSSDSSGGISPAKFDPNVPSQYPQTKKIKIQFVNFPNVGVIKMIEGIENETLVDGNGNPGETRYPRLILHGIFHDEFRRWRADIVNKKTPVQKRQIYIDLLNSNDSRVYRIDIKNAWPVRYTIPPLSTTGSTEYLERIELEYSSFEIYD